jgi:hypothetical protein
MRTAAHALKAAERPEEATWLGLGFGVGVRVRVRVGVRGR